MLTLWTKDPLYSPMHPSPIHYPSLLEQLNVAHSDDGTIRLWDVQLLAFVK